MLKAFSVALFSVFALFFSLLVFQPCKIPTCQEQIQLVSKISLLPSISLSSARFEERIPVYADFSNRYYLTLKKHTFNGFVYAK